MTRQRGKKNPFSPVKTQMQISRAAFSRSKRMEGWWGWGAGVRRIV